VPIGVPAELYVGGAGLGRGYLNRPELTDERFIPHPFKKLGKARLYKSGDLARYLPNGDFEYLGRGDQQVQVRGFRVELGEIEVVLGEVEDVRKTVVVLREDEPGDERIVAYFVTASLGQVSAAELRKHLRKKLPEYMIPQYFVELPSIPLTPNGKADRKALPPPPKHRQAQESYEAPRNKTEKTVANIWEEILHLKKVGAYDSFFELGGHSLLAMRVVSRLRREMGVEIKFKEFFNHPTVRALASQIELQLSERQGEGASSTLEGGDVEVVEI